MSLQMTTWQTVGPFFRIGLERLFDQNMAAESVAGERVSILGRLVDGLGAGIPDAVVEVWQANSFGKYAHPEDTQDKPLEPEFTGFGRIATDDAGFFGFSSIVPGPVPGLDAEQQAPHLVVGILMRGLLRGLKTRAYFPDDPRNERDMILGLLQPARRRTLIMQRSPERTDLLTWEIRMQGENETVFLDY